MSKYVVLVMALVGVAHADTPEQAKVKALETQVVRLEERLKKLEATNAQYSEALDFLQKVYVQQKAQAAIQDESEHAPDKMFAVDIADSVRSGHMQGPAGAGVTVVWAFDLADPYSARMQAPIDELVAERKGKVRVVYKHMIVHPAVAVPAHHAACAAAKQGKFTAFFKAWWEKGYESYKAQRDNDAYSQKRILEIAKQAGLDTKRLEADMNGAECKKRVEADMAELTKFRVNATPTFFINGYVTSGAVTKSVFADLLDHAIGEVTKSGVPAAKYYANVVMKGEKQFRSKAAK
jgi:protein-disulfide isomerase